MVATSPRDEQVPALSAREAVVPEAAQRESEAALVRAYLPAVWRVLRRIGLSPHDADDVAQEVFITAFRKSGKIEPGKERAFLFGIALRLAARKRRWLRLRWRTSSTADVDAQLSGSPNASDLIEHKEALLLLDRTLGAMSEELRTTFVLFELEEMTMTEIAELTNSKPGTVASRLRRARELVSEAARVANAERKS